MLKKWVSFERSYDIVPLLIKRFNISELVARILVNRNISTIEEAERFLNHTISDLYDPYQMKDMDKAVVRLRSAIEQNHKICVYGDYDVDGITATTILVKGLQAFNANVMYYIPNRMEEGYGINKNAVSMLKENGVDLILTVDCGIRSVDVVDHVNALGFEIIITDHHECGETLPNAYCILNPHQPDCHYPFKELAGVGVAYKLLCALLKSDLDRKISDPELMTEIIEIVAIGTIADVVPLVDENRIIVKQAFTSIAHTRNKGLRALIEVSNASERIMNTYGIAFIIAPRLNAAGRLAEASLCVELFLTENEDRAYEIAKMLDVANKERQTVESEILNSAIRKIESEHKIEEEQVLVLDDENWHVGVIGIVASRLVERYGLPVILLSRDASVGKGSARSLPSFNIYEAMNRCSELFDKFGGHELAAGVTLKIENIEAFKNKMKAVAAEMTNGQKILPIIKVDYKLSPVDVHFDMIKQINMLEPFGSANPAPLFVYRGLTVISAKTVGAEQKHLSLLLSDGRNELRCIAFNLGNLYNSLSTGKKIDIICGMELNTWNQLERIQLNIKDIKIAK